MSLKIIKLMLASLAVSILVVVTSVECSEDIGERIEDLKDQFGELNEEYKKEMDEIFWEHQATAERMIAESAGNDGYALMEISKQLASVETAFYMLERNAMLTEQKVLEQNIGYFMENPQVAHLVSFRCALRQLSDSVAAIKLPVAKLYKLIEHYVAKHRNNAESIPEEVRLVIKDVFRLFEGHQDHIIESYERYLTVINGIAAEENVDREDIKKLAASHDHMIDALTDCKDCSTTGKVYNPEHNIRSMFSSQEELEAFVSKEMDERVANKMEEIEQTVEGHLSVELDTNATAEIKDLFELWAECVRESII